MKKIIGTICLSVVAVFVLGCIIYGCILGEPTSQFIAVWGILMCLIIIGLRCIGL